MSDRIAIIPGHAIESGAWARLSPAAAKVLIALAYHADAEGNCWPSLTTIATIAGVHRTSATRAITELEGESLLTRKRSGGGRSAGGSYDYTTHYRLAVAPVLPLNGEQLHTRDRLAVAPVHVRGSTSAREGLHQCYTKDTEKDTEKEGAHASRAPGAMTFPTRAGEWSLPRQRLDQYRTTYPGLDIERELRKARQWCEDNPTRRKTARGMPAFLTRWLSKADTDRASGNGHQPSVLDAEPVEPPDDVFMESDR